MKLLLDTHIFLWLCENPKRLYSRELEACNYRGNQLYLSMVSVWEMQIKIQLGKLQTKDKLETIIETEMRENSLQILAIKLSHLYYLGNLELRHGDPFDRLLVAQAASECLKVLTHDEKIRSYDSDIFF